jgi:hypothetical protein
MNDILFDYLDDFCMAYLDNILIYLENPLKHNEHVQKVLEHLRNASLQVNVKKSKFQTKHMKYLSFIVSTERIDAGPDKIMVVRNWKAPVMVK